MRSFWYNRPMAKRKTIEEKRPVFDSIRKPTAPPSQTIGSKMSDEKHLPSLRKTKHKKPAAVEE
jgi:hypothetical protein